MFTTLVASSKGGCGKSTLVTQLASHWAQAGQQTTIIDADRQGSSLRWTTLRPATVPSVAGLAGSRRSLGKIPADTEQLLIDAPAGAGPQELSIFLEAANVLLIPVLPSSFDLDATRDFLAELQNVPRIKRGKLPVALVGNRLKPWTHASQDAITELSGSAPFPVVAQLRDSQAYVLLSALGKGIFDYQSEQVRSHQEDWKPLLRWIKRQR
ncbi:MAG: ParA family protein [Rhodanobacter sp.]